MSFHHLLSYRDDLAATYIATRPYAGLAVGVIDGKQRFAQGYGHFSEDLSRLPNEQTLFEIGSITKLFTGMTFAKLEQEGALGLENTIAQYLPPDVQLPPPVQAITLRQLATHTSGLTRGPENLSDTLPYPDDPDENPYVNYTAQDMYACLSRMELLSPPGTKFAYSNLGMSLLGHILELHTGQPYERLIQTTICQPLGLSDTCITLSSAQHQRLIPAYAFDGRRVSNWDFQVMAPGGALRSTVHDLLTFLVALLADPPEALVPAFRRSQETSFIHTMFAVGFAWIIRTRSANQIVYYHNGGTRGYTSFLGFDKRHQIGVVVLSNSGDTSVQNSATDDVDTMGFTLLEELARCRTS
jgi:serine-type D-Ala-D-Ala carboxypeptidase/endopeptidase